MKKDELVEKYYNELNEQGVVSNLVANAGRAIAGAGRAIGRGAVSAGKAIGGGFLNSNVLPTAIGAVAGNYALDQILDFGRELMGAGGRGKGEVQPSNQQQIDLAKQFAKGDRTALFAAGGIGKNYDERQASKGQVRRLAAQLSQDELRSAKKEALGDAKYQDAKKAYWDKYAQMKIQLGGDPILKRTPGSPDAIEMKKLHQAMKDAEKAALGGSERYQTAKSAAEVTAPIFQSSTTVTERPRNSDLGIKRNAVGQYVQTSSYVNPNDPEGRIKAQAEAQEAESRRFGPRNQEEALAAARADTERMYDQFKTGKVPIITGEEEVAAATARNRIGQAAINSYADKLRSNLDGSKFGARERSKVPQEKKPRFTREELLRKGLNPDLADIAN